MIIGHKKQWDFVSSHLSRVYLFSGPEEVGKKHLALELAREIFKTDIKNHPDVLQVSPAEGEIQISQIRSIQEFLNLKPYYGPLKIVIVDSAELMNQAAQSCFLKTLEEPKGSVLIILISSRPQMLLGTIISRCQPVKFYNVSQKEMKKHFPDVFELADGKPGRAIKLDLSQEKEFLGSITAVFSKSLSEKFQFVKNIPEGKFQEVLHGARKYLRYLLLLKIGAVSPSPCYPLIDMPIDKIRQSLKRAEFMDYQLSTSNASPKLALEVLLMEI